MLVGVVSFSNNDIIAFYMNAHLTKAGLQDAITSIDQIGGMHSLIIRPTQVFGSGLLGLYRAFGILKVALSHHYQEPVLAL